MTRLDHVILLEWQKIISSNVQKLKDELTTPVESHQRSGAPACTFLTYFLITDVHIVSQMKNPDSVTTKCKIGAILNYLYYQKENRKH